MADLSDRLARLPAAQRDMILQRLGGGPRPAPAVPMDAATFRRLTVELPAGAVRAMPTGTVDSAFTAQVAATPDATAIVDDRGTTDFATLDRYSNRIAHALLDRGMGRGHLVPVSLRRGADGAAALLGVLKAGAAYVPVEPGLPAHRVRSILDSIGADCALATGDQAACVADSVGTVLTVDSDEVRGYSEDPPARSARPDDPAYVLFTSGSSGSPKGVVVDHRAVHHFSVAIRAEYEITAADTVLQFASYSYDVSVFELFASLLSGARMLVVPDDVKYTPERLMAALRKHRVTVAELPPGLLPLLDAGQLPDLRLVSVGGETFPGAVVNQWTGPGRRFVNGYGPTECTVAVTTFDCGGVWDRMPPIGRPLPNHRAYVLDADLRPVPIGDPGELCVAGPQVARGYLNEPELTAERFVANPYRTGETDATLYRTGDRVRWTSDGQLEILGRLDRQVKVRGFRVEPRDIEVALEAHPSVGHARVEYLEVADGERALVAYVVPSTADASGLADQLRPHLADRLPAYMVPHLFVELSAFPLTGNGKVDVAALPRPTRVAGGRPRVDAVPDAPSNAEPSIEETARDIAGGTLAGLLGVEMLDNDMDFFRAGGDSLMAIKAVTAVGVKHGVDLSVLDFFDDPTPRRLAEMVRDARARVDGERASLQEMLDGIRGGDGRLVAP